MGYQQMSNLGLRYASPPPDLEETLRQVVEETPTQVEWTLDTSRRNWVLFPSRIFEESGGVNSPDFQEVKSRIIHTDQDFCIAAFQDLSKILQRLETLPYP
ncbi:hypothetical protein [Streptomyces sp. NPDC054863]